MQKAAAVGCTGPHRVQNVHPMPRTCTVKNPSRQTTRPAELGIWAALGHVFAEALRYTGGYLEEDSRSMSPDGAWLQHPMVEIPSDVFGRLSLSATRMRVLRMFRTLELLPIPNSSD